MGKVKALWAEQEWLPLDRRAEGLLEEEEGGRQGRPPSLVEGLGLTSYPSMAGFAC